MTCPCRHVERVDDIFWPPPSTHIFAGWGDNVPPTPTMAVPIDVMELERYYRPTCNKPRVSSLRAWTSIVTGPGLQNILRQSYDYLTIMPKLRSTYDGRLVCKPSYDCRKINWPQNVCRTCSCLKIISNQAQTEKNIDWASGFYKF